ncbi:MAG: hypothetical protein Q8L48_28515 [Archangium sp.]|nr:hypothetical protein [Archangium sp.]
MGIRIGTVFTGTVDQVGEESIQTKFFMIGVPLIPMESFFVLRDRGNGVDGFPIPLNAKSVLLAYLRWGAFIAAIIAGVMAMVTPSYRRGPADFIFAGVAVVAWGLLTFLAGRPNKASLARRLIFKAATGISATPDLVPAHVASEIHESLQKNPMQDSAAWRFVASSYQARLENSEQARAAAEAAWAQLGGTSTGTSSLVADDQNR